jgi:hypothetical protein
MLLAFLPPFIATLALVLSVASNFWCETISFPPTMEFANSNNNNFTDVDGTKMHVQSFGPFFSRELVLSRLSNSPMMAMEYYHESYQCVALPESVALDSKWKATQAFAIIAVIVGTITVFYSWFLPCYYASTSKWKRIAFIFILCSIFQGLTLLLVSSAACYNNGVMHGLQPYYYSTTCQWDWGARTNVASVILWIMSGFLMAFVIPPPLMEPLQPPETQTVTYTKNYDGTISEVAIVKGIYVPNQGIVSNPNTPEETAPQV